LPPPTDLIAYYTSLLREDFPESVRRTIPPLHETETVLFKSRFSAACEQIGQAIPTTRSPQGLDEALLAARELDYPLILKPKSHIVIGSAERGALIYDENDLRARFRPYCPAPGQSSLAEKYPELLLPVLQRYVPSARTRVYSVSGFKDVERGIVAATLSYKREQWPVDVGTSTVQVSCQDPHMLQEGLQVIDKLVSCGIFELELLKDGDRLLAIDLNPRAFGFMNLDMSLGRDLPWLWLQSTLGPVDPPPEPIPYLALEARHAPLYFLRHFADWRVLGRRQPSVDRRDPARERRRISLLGDWSDPLPKLLSHAILLKHPRSLIRAHFGSSQSERDRQSPAMRPA